jgi:prepilin-type N-terminal cleavage/methylation domain-containing protein
VHARAFTLLEVVIVLAVTCVLAALVVPAVFSLRHRGRRVACGSNLRNLGVATVMYAFNNGRALPTHHCRATASFDTFAMLDDAGNRVNLGLLVDYAPGAPVFYCPTQTEETSPSIAYNGPRNRWRFRYLEGPEPEGAGAGEHGGGVNSSYPVRSRFDPVPELPRWSLVNYTNKVIYSDFIGVDGWIGTGPLAGPIRAPHGGDGYNRLFGDDSVQWVDAGTVNATRPVSDAAPAKSELQEYYLLLDVAP